MKTSYGGSARHQSRHAAAARALCACGAALTLGASACSQQTGPITVPVASDVLESMNRYARVYTLTVGDQMDIVVQRHPELSVKAVVRQDGYISMPLLQDVKAAGLGVPDLCARLKELLSARLVDPEVNVMATTIREPMVYVLGDVPRPGPIPYRQAHTALQAVAQAGGFLRSAGPSGIAIVRLTQDAKLRAYLLTPPVDGQIGPYLALQASLLEPEDLIFVPEGPRSQFVRFVQDYLNTPLQAVNNALTPYYQFKVIEDLAK